ncbi:tyrosine-protein phosphatase [Geomicrobium sp. JSM 1781026]|uniref:tyrosine-protein phosphatase n=1 Tax=Geomicrobium sp. JSM 1781026 TaxID=3344580 RepID=UPI0035C21224
MIDIHCHILPGIDDGSPHLQESISMAKDAVRSGIHTMVATPHHRLRHYENSREKVLQRVEDFNRRLFNEDVNLTVLPGQETRIYGDMLEGVYEKELLTLNDGDKYLFVELPGEQIPTYTSQLLYNVLQSGITPIVVHPERNSAIRAKPNWLYDIVNSGVATQLTAGSLTGEFGKATKQFANSLIEHELVHFIASDTHGMKRRKNRLQQAYKQIQGDFGDETVLFFQENAELAVAHQHIMMNEPSRIKKKKVFGLF